jgi:hypothetical protein
MIRRRDRCQEVSDARGRELPAGASRIDTANKNVDIRMSETGAAIE